LDRAVSLKSLSPPVDDKAKKLASLLEAMEIPLDIAMPMADELVADHPSLPLATLVHKATAYLAQDRPKAPTISKVKRTEWGRLPQGDLRLLYADGSEVTAYDSFKKAGLVFNLQSLLGKVG
ncbi:transporter, partial [Aeromonas salmonicida]